MKQKLILFSSLLIIFLLAGTASAIGETENTDTVSTSVAGPSVNIAYNESGPFKMGDIVKITATFSESVLSADLTIDSGGMLLFVTEMDNLSGTVWCYNYTIPDDVNDAVNVTVSGVNTTGDFIEKIDIDAFVIDNEAPRFHGVQPNSTYINTDCIVFEFSAFDKLDNTIDYAICINGTEVKTGTLNSNGSVKCEIEKPDGYYQWEVKLQDDAGNNDTSGLKDLYVDTRDPIVTLVSPENNFVNTTGLINFNFTCQDSLSANYSLDLYYQLYLDGIPADISGSGRMASGEYVEIPEFVLEDGAHNWSVLVEDEAGNNCTGEVRNFYVNQFGLEVQLISPNGGFAPADSTFNFSISGGAGLPFDYELLINGTKVENGNSVIEEDGVTDLSLEATVADGVNIPWTVKVTDNAGRTKQPEPLFFSVDTKAPAPVANLTVTDALSDTTWYYTYDEPGIYVRWDKNTEEDLYDGIVPYFGLPGEEAYLGLPYVVFISDSKPSCVEDMQVALPVSTIYPTEDGKSLYMNIGTYGGKPLVYGKDYWVAVIALDNAGNYECNICGPVQTYEDMNITLNAGWNLKSVPKRLATFDADTCSAFGDDSTVIYWNGSCWEFPKTIEPCKGYWVYSPEACQTNVKFKPMPVSSASPDVPASLDLAAGWQMIGHTSTLPVHWSQTLGSLQSDQSLANYKFSNLITYSHNEGWGGTINLGFISLLEDAGETPYPVQMLETSGAMVPGQGYWIFMKEDGTYASVESVNFYINSTSIIPF